MGVKAWVLADSVSGYTWNLQIYTGKEEGSADGLNLQYIVGVKAFVPLSPIFVSSDIRPDLVMYKNSIPVLVIEVHSSPYEQTLRKLAFVLIEQLRLLRNLDETRDEVHGFSFPKSSEPSCVSQMTVTWNSNNLHFDVAYSVFKMEKVKENVEQAVSQIYHLQVSRFQGLLLSCNKRRDST